MKQKAIVLVWDSFAIGDHTAQAEVLFTPAYRWLPHRYATENTLVFHNAQPEIGVESLSCAHLFTWVKKQAADHFLVAGADAPLLCEESITEAESTHRLTRNAVTLLGGFGTATGAGWYRKDALLAFLSYQSASFCLADLLAFIQKEYAIVGDFGYYAIPELELLPATTPLARQQLSTAAKEQICGWHLQHGVDIPLFDGIVIAPTVQIGAGTTILPGTILKGDTTIGTGCQIGPNSVLQNAVVHNNSHIISSYIEDSSVESETKIGPMSRLRPGSQVGSHVKIGNFVEVKNSTIGDSTAISHLTYVGDSDIGTHCNIGCGVVTVNYDGRSKNRTTIGNHVFVGCNCNLIAPVTLADNSYAAAGTTITNSVPQGALVIGRSRQTLKEHWADQHGLFRKK